VKLARRQSQNIIDLRPKGPKGVDWEMLFAPPGASDKLGPFPGAIPEPEQMVIPPQEFDLPDSGPWRDSFPSGPAGGSLPPNPPPPSGPQGALDMNTLLAVVQGLGSPPSQPNQALMLRAQLNGLYGPTGQGGG
jgi:hypothetical protein